MEYRLVNVEDKRTKALFHDVMRLIYKNDKNFICPPDDVIEGIFTPGKNVFFNHGEATRWILLDENNKLVGRVAALSNRKKHIHSRCQPVEWVFLNVLMITKLQNIYSILARLAC